MKTFIRTAITTLLLTLLINSGYAQCTVVVTSDGKCEGTTLYANTSGGTVEQLRWMWKSRGDSLLFTSTINQSYGPGVTVAGGNGRGDANNQTTVEGIYVDKHGTVYIADVNNHRVQKWLSGAQEGTTVAGGNGYGSASNQLALPHDVWVDEADNLYVSDPGNARVQKWAPGATEGITIAGGNGEGSAPNQLANPAGIYLDKEGGLYIADEINSRVQKWLPGATEGITVAGGNGNGNAANQTAYPEAVFVDSLGNLYVTGDGVYSNRVQKWAPGAKEGITVAGGIEPGSANDHLNTPNDVFIDHLGNLFVTDMFNNRIQKFLPSSLEGITVAGIGVPGSGPYELDEPHSVWVLDDSIYAGDAGNYRVQRYTPEGKPPVVDNKFIPSNGGNYTATAIFKQGCVAASNALHVKGLPKFKAIKGKQRNLCGGGSFVYTADVVGEAINYKWSAPAGCTIVSGQGTSTLTLNVPASFSSGVLSVAANNSCGAGPVFSDTLTTKPAQPGPVNGPDRVRTYDTVTFRVDPVDGMNYRWEIPVAGVVIINGQNTPKINVAWNSFESGNVVVKAAACVGGTEATNRKLVERVSSLVASNTDALKTNTGATNLKVYPNPAFNKATAEFAAAGAYTLQVRDMAGKVLYTLKGIAAKGINKVEIDLNRFAKGNYFLVVTDDSGKKVTQLSKQ